MSEENYQVGYGKPPRFTQFAPGQSGNSKGRPKGSKNVMILVREVSMAQIRVNVNGRTRKISKMEAILTQATNKAVAGVLVLVVRETRLRTRMCFHQHHMPSLNQRLGTTRSSA